MLQTLVSYPLTDPGSEWRLHREYYIQLTQVEEAFKSLKGDLSLRPVDHQREDRIEAHIFVSFLAYWLHATWRRSLRRDPCWRNLRRCR